RYACIIDREIPFIQWQDIGIEPLPNIIVGDKMRQFQCTERTVELTCCESQYEVEWTPIAPADYVTPPDNGCITLKHKILSTDCTKREFTCQLKILELQKFSYGQSTVTVEKKKDELPCKSTMLGDGNNGKIVTGPCEKGKDGTITYECRSSEWTEIYRDCILQVIKNIENKVENLVPLEIPDVVADLSTATQNNTQEITQSAVTVQTIVEILVKVADVSQKIIISQPVMENFLKTVDILVSSFAIDTWKNLNNDSRTDNTSTALLSAIENISSRLTDANFRINETSIELNRTVTNSTFYSGISSLPNSTTEIQIPEIPIYTPITIIVLTTLDSILPTRNISNNGTNPSDVRINGDVVVVKVDNKTINNISFAFDITNQSLGNPQCVFWNFKLDAWDSTGCEAKPYISNGNETGKITCECNHTTSFSILMSPFVIDHEAIAYITYIGVSISMASLIICLIIETIIWKSMTRNDTSYMRHVSIVNIAVSLLIANVCFIIGAAVAESEQPTSVGRCSPVVFFMHFFYLALFFWMLISALLLFYRTVIVFSQMSRAKMMVIAFIVGYGAPLLIASITVASTAGPEYYVTKRNACWLNWLESKALLAFVIPALTIVAINLVVLIVVLYKTLRRGVGTTTQSDEKHALVVTARCVAILTPIFGLTWGFGIGTMVSQDFGIHVVFALLNSLQGFFILVFGTLLDSKIRAALAGTFSNVTSSNRTRSTSAGPSSSSGQGLLQRFQRRNVYNISENSAVS
ncbi:adhesion G-protein coupled receptor F1-like, partial [Garra rufa]|uniref:adhesion G-protein coupled receptor F1-like n=1 Tax=Garra rufa TaxID=137080 RepID=UPI003CCEC027